MTAPSFFGYGSLVNLATHPYRNARNATVQGWARSWVNLPEYDQAILTAVRCDGSQIDGVLADVPGGDWSALDTREAGYERCALEPQTAIYAVDIAALPAQEHQKPILLSYLDVVIQGYQQRFGSEGPENFWASTQGWDRAILNDRACPHYPRHQRLSPAQTRIVDEAIAMLGLEVIPADSASD